MVSSDDCLSLSSSSIGTYDFVRVKHTLRNEYINAMKKFMATVNQKFDCSGCVVQWTIDAPKDARRPNEHKVNHARVLKKPASLSCICLNKTTLSKHVGSKNRTQLVLSRTAVWSGMIVCEKTVR